MNCISRKLQLILVSTLFALPLPLFAAAGKVVIAAGDVFAVNAQDERRQLQRRSDIFEGDTLVTGEDGRLQLRFEDNAILALRANSQLRISEYHGPTDGQNERVLMDLLGGGFRTISGSFGKSDRDAYQVRTPNASIGIRGTHYEAVFESDTLSVGVYEGGISLTNDQGTLNLGLDSEFVFAQVQAGNLPQGLLNPPANLNVPNTPESDDDNAEEGDEETTPDETNTDEPEDIAAIPVTTTDDNTFSTDDFNFTNLEDAFSELQKKTVVLTEAEQQGLQNDATVVGILVMAPSETGSNGQPISENGPLFAYGTLEDNNGNPGSPFFVAYEDQDLDDNLNNPPNFVLRPNADSPPDFAEGQDPFPWQEWNNSEESGPPSTADAGENTGFNSGTVDQPFFYVTAEPMQASLVANADFLLSGLVTNFSVIDIDFETSYLNITIDDMTTEGLIEFVNSGPFEEHWSLAFDGEVNGNTLSATLNNSSSLSLTQNGQAGPGQIQDQFGLDGNVNGIITGSPGELGITGGFTAQSDGSDHEAYGVFVMEEYEKPCDGQEGPC